jgi:hypothetical protein
VWAGAAAVLDEAKGHLFKEIHAGLKNTEQPHLRARLAAHRIRPAEDAARLFEDADAAGSWQAWARVVEKAAPGWLSGACLFVPFNYEGRRRPIRLAKCNGPNGRPLEGQWRDDTAALVRERLALIADITGAQINVGARIAEVRRPGAAPERGSQPTRRRDSRRRHCFHAALSRTHADAVAAAAAAANGIATPAPWQCQNPSAKQTQPPHRSPSAARRRSRQRPRSGQRRRQSSGWPR